MVAMVLAREEQLAKFNALRDPFRWGLILLLAGSLWIGARFYVAEAMSPVSAPAAAVTAAVTIQKGATVREIGDQLAQKGLIRNKNAFLILARMTGKEKQLKAGSYRISSAWPLSKILDRVVGGQVATSRVTIPEGYNLAQIRELLAARGFVNADAFRDALNTGDFSYAFLKDIPQGEQRLEGFLFPDTYEVRDDITAKEIIDLMLKRFDQAFTPDLRQRAAALGWSCREVVTLASLVEREAKLDQERPLVASVFLNRLKYGIPLGSCATIQYILGEPKDPLTYADLKIPSPYNTYLHQGLPPGPIANPGLASIKAVLYPAQEDYLYFVARGDGSHQFSRTLGEHETAARRYIK